MCLETTSSFFLVPKPKYTYAVKTVKENEYLSNGCLKYPRKCT